MRVNPTDKRPCKLERGDVRRVPQRRESRVIGYHVCCPRCGFVTPALVGDDGLEIREGDAVDDITLSKPLRCNFCCVILHLTNGDLHLEEDAHVRNARYR